MGAQRRRAVDPRARYLPKMINGLLLAKPPPPWFVGVTRIVSGLPTIQELARRITLLRLASS